MIEADRLALLQRLQTSMIGADKGDLQGNLLSFHDGYVHTFRDLVALSVFLGDDFRSLRGSVRAQEFYALLSKFTEDVLRIDVGEDGLTVRCGRSKATFNYQEDVVITQVEKMDVGSLVWTPLPEDFREALKFCLLDSRDYNLEGIRVQGKKMVSIDSKRMNYFEMDADGGDYLIESKVAAELLKFDSAAEIAHSSSRIFLKLPDGTIVSGRKRNTEEYPLEKIFGVITRMKQPDGLGGGPFGKLPSSFRQMIGRANVLSIEYGGMNLLHITFAQDGIQCESRRSVGKYSERIDWEDVPTIGDNSVQVVLETSSMLYALERSTAFYIVEIEGNKRMVFTGDNCACFLAAYSIDDIEES
jgi:hypothetical protein